MAVETPYRIEIVNRKLSFYCLEEQLLLNAMERKNLRAIPVGCRGGGCGVCKVRIIDGSYQTKRMSRAHISEEEEKQGFALACRVFPLEDLLIETAVKEKEILESVELFDKN